MGLLTTFVHIKANLMTPPSRHIYIIHVYRPLGQGGPHNTESLRLCGEETLILISWLVQIEHEQALFKHFLRTLMLFSSIHPKHSEVKQILF